MVRYLLARVFQAAIVMFVISIIAVIIQNNLGDPLRELIGQSVSEVVREQYREDMGLNDSFIIQYNRFIVNAMQGDLGTSYFLKEPALKIITTKLSATLELVFLGAIISMILSTTFGVIAAIKHNTIWERLILGISIVGISVPIFISAVLMIYIFSIKLGWLPSYGRGETITILGFWETSFLTIDGLKHIILPSISLALIMLPLFIRLIHSEMLTVLQSEFIKYARAKGVSRFRIYFVHALKNALLPVITVAGVQIGTMLAFTILTESIYQWPGMGYMFIEAISRADTPLIVANLIVVGLIFVVTNTLVDIIYGFINPKVKLARVSE